MPYFLGVGPLEPHAPEVQVAIKELGNFTKDCFFGREF